MGDTIFYVKTWSINVRTIATAMFMLWKKRKKIRLYGLSSTIFIVHLCRFMVLNVFLVFFVLTVSLVWKQYHRQIKNSLNYMRVIEMKHGDYICVGHITWTKFQSDLWWWWKEIVEKKWKGHVTVRQIRWYLKIHVL